MTHEIPVWILTFNRPFALDRLIAQLSNEGFTNINIMSNHPDLVIDQRHESVIKKVVINSLNDINSNSWCARSWNSIFLKNFKDYDTIMCIQDDTTIESGFGDWFENQRSVYDFMWGPAGDQWFYLTIGVLRSVGWFDERYLACFCGDADWLKRIYQTYDKSKLSIEERHVWGFTHNPSGISGLVKDGDARQWNEQSGGYMNQCQEFERDGTFNTVLQYCQAHYLARWGVKLDDGSISTQQKLQLPDVDWYPWFTKLYLHTAGN